MILKVSRRRVSVRVGKNKETRVIRTVYVSKQMMFCFQCVDTVLVSCLCECGFPQNKVLHCMGFLRFTLACVAISCFVHICTLP